ncbi:E3 ubiquitin-protein ligase TRIM35-like [Periophthalmus magnuspinnatus]|uniref:E3 ubiquitin-protein ligase TRIM35-like n=1 Tax=Periophthalmus magnuspinnatus TaxID=409849 RepID=UPI00145A362A|nr:E3 ubiquitin-protein ligase TRIM35-like [Periophthalmus magnuspinnatus]
MAEAEVTHFLTCSICLDTFTEPVSLGCHHSFCRTCLQKTWAQEKEKNCPVCRRKSSKSDPGVNFALKELSDSLRQKLQLSKTTEQQTSVETHERKEEKREEGGEEGEVKVQASESVLQSLREQRDQVRARLDLCNEIVQHSEEQALLCERQITAVFERMRRHLQEEQDRAVSALREEQRRQAQTINPQLHKLRETLSSLNSNIQELEKQLKTHTHRPLSSSPEPLPQLPKGLLLNQAKVLGNLGYRVWTSLRRVVQFSPVILDPNTARGWLYLSEDLSGATNGDTYQQLPDNPERFSNYTMVLGSEGFSSGTHQWDVEVGDHPSWNIGVAKESIDRKGEIFASPKYGIWCLFHTDGKYDNGCGKPVKVQNPPEKIRVKLDFNKGKVSFYDTDHMTHLYTHTGRFTEKMFPYFGIGPSKESKTKEVRVCPTSGPQ